ncbi:MAG TPA: hypothetical protein VJK01_01315 [Candidatus Paceibacterota bacterium]
MKKTVSQAERARFERSERARPRASAIFSPGKLIACFLNYSGDRTHNTIEGKLGGRSKMRQCCGNFPCG